MNLILYKLDLYKVHTVIVKWESVSLGNSNKVGMDCVTQRGTLTPHSSVYFPNNETHIAV